jgi:hypothetical protein
VDLIRVAQRRQRPEPPRQIFISGRGHAQCAKAIVAGEVEIFEQRQARRLLNDADDPLAPPVRPRVVDSPDDRVLRR